MKHERGPKAAHPGTNHDAMHTPLTLIQRGIVTGCALSRFCVAAILLFELSHMPALAQILTTVHPNKAEQNKVLTVTISGENTHFAQASSVTGARFVQGGSTLNGSNVNVLSNTQLNVDFSIPRSASTGPWNVIVQNTFDGTLTLPNGFNLELAAPANLRITNIATDRITLSWTDNSGTELGFRLERKLGTTGTFQEIATVGPNVTAFQNTGLIINTQYCYRVRAYEAAGHSAYSNECCGLTNGSAALNSVNPNAAEQNQNLTVSISGQNTNFLQGTGTGVTGVRFVQRGTTINASNFFVNNNTSLGASFNILRNTATGLWDVIVQSIRDGTLMLTQSFRVILAQPTRLTTSAVSPHQIDLSWQDNSDTETGYLIEQRLGLTGAYQQIAVTGANTTSFSPFDLDASTLYCYRVAAFDSGGISEYSNESCATTATPPIVPIITSVVPDHAEQAQSLAVTVTGFGTHFQQGNPIGTTEVKLQQGNAVIGAGNFFAFDDTLLRANFDLPRGAALGLWNISVTTMLDGAITLSNGFRVDLGSPLDLRTTAVFSRQINLRWTDQSDTEDGFQLERKPGVNGAYQIIALLNANDSAYPDTGLTPQTQYCYRVAALRGGAASKYSNEICATTPPAVAITSVNPDHGEQTQALSVTITGQNTHFQQGSGTHRVWLSRGGAVLDATSFVADNDAQLRANFSLAASTGTGLWNLSVLTSLDGTIMLSEGFTVALAAPADLTAVAVSSGQINLNWRDRSGTEQGYRIERKTGAGGEYQNIATVAQNAAAFQDTSVAEQTLYCYRVRAFDAIGASAYSNEGCDTTAAAAFQDIAASLPGVLAGDAAWGDFDNDGDLDIALTGSTTPSPNYHPLSEIYRNETGSFVPIAARLQPVAQSDLAWGDYDNDGDLDLLLSGDSSSSFNATPFTRVYRNDRGTFAAMPFDLAKVRSSTAAWGDFDNDGDLDLVLAGRSSNEQNLAKIYRNDVALGQGFTDIGARLPGVLGGSVAWGDYDADGDLDLALNGDAGAVTLLTKIYRNDGAVFYDLNAPLRGMVYGSVAWSDYDLDGDLDLLVHGFDGAGQTVKLYSNTGGNFIDSGMFIPGPDGAAAWGDYDNDGDADILLSGWTGQRFVSKIYRNDHGSFVDVNAPLPGVATLCSAGWGDFDNDADLDILLTGETMDAGTLIAKIYRNNVASKNTPPSAPMNLSAVVNGSTVTLSWSGAIDTQTPQASLTYNLRIGTSPGGAQVVSPMSDSTGARRLPQYGNVNHRISWTIRNLSNGAYYWSVQALDHTFAGSAFAPEQSFEVTTSGVAHRAPADLPTKYELAQNYPNPFNPTTVIRFGLPRASSVTLKIYDVMGNEVATLLKDEHKAAGYHTAAWSGRNRAGQLAPSGVYLYVLRAGETRLRRRLVFMK